MSSQEIETVEAKKPGAHAEFQDPALPETADDCREGHVLVRGAEGIDNGGARSGRRKRKPAAVELMIR